MKPSFVFVALVFLTPLQGAEKQTAISLAPIYRAHAFSAQPSLNPDVRFVLNELSISGLWESLRVQIFNVDGLVRDSSIPRDPFIYCDGKIFPFVHTFGGSGLMSGVVLDDTFYYTYSWGSGIHRSLVGRLRIVDGKPDIQESTPYLHKDVFVEKASGKARVVLASFRGFNQWETPSPIGWVDLREPKRLKIIDDAGSEVQQTGSR